jgi:heat shock protein HslJ
MRPYLEARMIRSVLTVVAALALSATACADDGNGGSGDDGGALEDVTWVLQSSSIDELVAEAPADARVDLVFSAGEIAGQSACNRYGGPYEVDGSSISFGDLFSTNMACEQPLMDIESAYLTALGNVDAYEVSAEELVLTGGDVRLAFDAEAAQEPLRLDGTAWSLEAIGTGVDAVSSPIAGTQVTLELQDDGSASGSGGCNQFNTSFETDGATISFGPVGSTQIACELDVMDQETAVLGALESAATFEIVGDLLTLSDAGGGFLVSYRGA